MRKRVGANARRALWLVVYDTNRKEARRVVFSLHLGLACVVDNTAVVPCGVLFFQVVGNVQAAEREGCIRHLGIPIAPRPKVMRVLGAIAA